MRNLFAVVRTRGRAWDTSKPMRSQLEWNEHAAFMDKLADDGFIVLGGPLEDSGDTLLVFDAAGKSEINAMLSDDPWSKSGVLETKSIQGWEILLEHGK